MAAEVHDDELIVGDEAAAVGAGSEAVAADLEGGFGNEVGLVLLLDGARVSGGIDEGGEKEGVLRETDAGGVAGLDGGALAAEEDGGRKDSSGIGGVEDFSLGACRC